MKTRRISFFLISVFALALMLSPSIKALGASYKTTYTLSNDEVSALVLGGSLSIFFDDDPTPRTLTVSRRGENSSGNVVFYGVLPSADVPSSWVTMRVFIDFPVQIEASAFSGSVGIWNQSVTFENPSFSLVGPQSGQVVTFDSSSFSAQNITYTQLSDGASLTRNFNICAWSFDGSMTVSSCSFTFEKLSTVQNNSSFTFFFGPFSYTLIDESAYQQTVIDDLDRIADDLSGNTTPPPDVQSRIDELQDRADDQAERMDEIVDVIESVPKPSPSAIQDLTDGATLDILGENPETGESYTVNDVTKLDETHALMSIFDFENGGGLLTAMLLIVGAYGLLHSIIFAKVH